MTLSTEADLQCRNLIQKHVGEVRLVATRLCEGLTAEQRQEILAVSGEEDKCREAVELVLRDAELARLKRMQAEHTAKGLTPPEGTTTPAETPPAGDADDPAGEADTDVVDEDEIDIATPD